MEKIILIGIMLLLISSVCFAEGSMMKGKVLNWLEQIIAWIHNWLHPNASHCINLTYDAGYVSTGDIRCTATIEPVNPCPNLGQIGRESYTNNYTCVGQLVT